MSHFDYEYTCFKTLPNQHVSDLARSKTKSIEDISHVDVTAPYYVEVFDNFEGRVNTVLKNVEQFEDFKESLTAALERRQWLKPGDVKDKASTGFEENYNKKGDGVHYQSYMTVEARRLQWLESMNRLSQYENPEVFIGAVALQVRKYLDRLGKKDKNLQELTKSLWYLKYLTAYVKNGHKPILVEDIDKILGQ
jgi:hypothetical protein